MKCEYNFQTAQDRQLFYLSKEWRNLRNYILREVSPLCVECKKQSKLVAAVDCHHDKPLHTHPELCLVISNIIPLCKSCHARIPKQPYKYKKYEVNISNLRVDINSLLNKKNNNI